MNIYHDPATLQKENLPPKHQPQTDVYREFAPPPDYVTMWPNAIDGEIRTKDVKLGVGVRIEAGVEIIADKVVIGDFVYIGRNTRIIVPEFTMGDYSRLNEDSFCGGTHPMNIGRNCYFGRSVQLDSRGGLKIGDNVGVGSLSQIWTHIRHGDVVQGCRWNKEYALEIETDVWLVARVTVGGAQRIGARAMVFNESNVTRNLLSDRTYAGNPACDVTESPKMGPQFEPLTPEQKLSRMNIEIALFEAQHPEHVGKLTASCYASEFGDDPAVSYFAVQDRVYTKKYSRAEVAFLKSTLAKFAPLEVQR